MSEATKWSFWRWFFRGVDGRKSGLSGFLSWWLLLHVVVAVILINSINLNIQDVASKVLFPLSSIFVGLSFAWVGNAQALLQTGEIEELSENIKGGLVIFLYNFQGAILIILVTLLSWGLAAMGISNHPLVKCTFAEHAIEFMLYFLASLTIRECWSVILISQATLYARYRVRKKNKNRNDESS